MENNVEAMKNKITINTIAWIRYVVGRTKKNEDINVTFFQQKDDEKSYTILDPGS